MDAMGQHVPQCVAPRPTPGHRETHSSTPTHRTHETHLPNPTHSITSILQLVRYVVLDLLA